MRIVSDFVNITGNRISDIRYNYIWLENAENCTIKNNDLINGTIYNPPTYEPVGIFLDGQDRAGSDGYGFAGDVISNTIVNNNISGLNDGVSILAGFNTVENNNISSNNIEFSAAAGIVIYSSGPRNNIIQGNNITNGEGHGIYMYYAWQHNITGNVIAYNDMNGILMDTCTDNIIFNNTIVDNGENGIANDGSDENTFERNIITGNTMHGISMSPLFCQSNVIVNNSIGNNKLSGIHASANLDFGLGNIIKNNTIYHNLEHGISIVGESAGFDMYFNQIFENEVSGVFFADAISNIDTHQNVIYNSPNGIVLNATQNLFIQGNIIYDCDAGFHITNGASFNEIAFNSILDPESLLDNLIAVYLSPSVYNNSIQNNTISECLSYGVYLEEGSFNNTVRFNSFLSNNEGGISQSYDNGSTNPIEYNHWSEWTTPDSDSDGIVDIEYTIDGDSGNTDPYPLTDIVDSGSYHNFSKPIVIYPNGGELLNASTFIEWTEALDTQGHDVFYTIFYSEDNGKTWVELATGLESSHYLWDMRTLPVGSDYLVKVRANCTEGLSAEDSSDSTFSHQAHELTEPTILSPNGGEIVNDSIVISWQEAVDSWECGISYSLEFSTDGGINWNLLAEDLSDSSYFWDTTNIPGSTEYLIRLNASCAEGLMTTDITDSVFTHNEHWISDPQVLSPNGGELVTDETLIEWAECIDNWGYSISYSLFYSFDSGENWISIASNLQNTSYVWNTSSLPKGSNYLIQLVVSSSDGLTREDNSDSTFSLIEHAITSPTLLYPNGGETVGGFVEIEWEASSDSWDHQITYNVYYSHNAGLDWYELVSGISDTDYRWNSTQVEVGSEFKIRVEAECKEGLMAHDDSDWVFTVIRHTLDAPTILNPEAGDVVSGVVTVEWTESVDSLDHNVSYFISISDDGGETWLSLAENISSSTYEWNTTAWEDGSNYVIRVTAYCDEGLIAESISQEFSVQNQDPTTGTTTTDTSTTTDTTSDTTDTVDDTNPMGGMIVIAIALVVAGLAAAIIIFIIIRKGVLGSSG
jgi:parallel beta-helix repeat protein